jgi:hypothetical protein
MVYGLWRSLVLVCWCTGANGSCGVVVVFSLDTYTIRDNEIYVCNSLPIVKVTQLCENVFLITCADIGFRN